MLHTIPILLAIKIQKPCKDFQESLDVKTRGTAGTTKLEVTTINKNNGRGINNRNTIRETEFQKVGSTNILKFQQEIIPILNKDIQNFRGGNLKNHLTKWKNVTGDKIILDIIEKWTKTRPNRYSKI